MKFSGLPMDLDFNGKVMKFGPGTYVRTSSTSTSSASSHDGVMFKPFCGTSRCQEAPCQFSKAYACCMDRGFYTFIQRRLKPF